MVAMYSEDWDKRRFSTILDPEQGKLSYRLSSLTGAVLVLMHEQVALSAPVKKAVGIELSPTRLEYGIEALKEIESRDVKHAPVEYKDYRL